MQPSLRTFLASILVLASTVVGCSSGPSQDASSGDGGQAGSAGHQEQGGGDQGGAEGLAIKVGETALEIGDVTTLDVTSGAKLSFAKGDGSSQVVSLDDDKITAVASGDAELVATLGKETAKVDIHVLGFSKEESLVTGVDSSVVFATSQDGATFAILTTSGTSTLRSFDPKTETWSASVAVAFPGTPKFTGLTASGKLLVVGYQPSSPDDMDLPPEAPVLSALCDVTTGKLSSIQKVGMVGPEVDIDGFQINQAGTMAAMEIHYFTRESFDNGGALLVRWTESAGFGAPVELDPISEVLDDGFGASYAMDNAGTVSGLYLGKTAVEETGSVRAVFATPGHAPTTPKKLLSGAESSLGVDCADIAVDSVTGRGILAYALPGSNDQMLQFYVAEIAPSGLTSAVATVGPMLTVDGGCPKAAVLPNGDAYLFRSSYGADGGTSTLSLLHYRPGHGLVDTKSDFGVDAFADFVFARRDGSLWIGASKGEGSEDNLGYFVERLAPDGTWEKPVSLASSGFSAGAFPSVGADKTFSLMLPIGDDATITTKAVVGTVYR